VESKEAKFSILVESEGNVSYQWKMNGSNISLGNYANLSLTNIEIDDDSSLISCQVSNENGTIISDTVKLFVSNNIERINNGKLVEYDFEEGTGAAIHNRIGNNNELDLNIYTTNAVNWITNGINIKDIPNIATSIPVTVINDSINYSNQF
jgi:hypothetical protein